MMNMGGNQPPPGPGQGGAGGGDMQWQTDVFRTSLIRKLEEAIKESGSQSERNAHELERQVFQKANSKEEYLSFVARLILHVRQQAGGVQQQQQQLQQQQPQQVVNSGDMMGGGMRPAGGGMMQPGGGQLIQMNPQQQMPQQQQQGMNMHQQQMMQQQQQQRMMQMQNMQQRGQMNMQMMRPGMQMQPHPRMQMARAPPPHYPPAGGLPTSSPGMMPQGPSPIPSYQPGPSPQQMQQPSPGGMLPMQPSPSSNVNTPMAPASHEDKEYIDKVKSLEKYIEPLRNMIAKIGSENDQDRLTKMKKLLDILSNPSRRMPLSTLQKCEDVLKRMALDTVEPDSSKDSKDSSSSLNPLLEAVINIRKNNSTAHLNHALSSTFLPPCQSFLGSPISLPPLPPSPDVSDDEEDIPNVLQGEIARLEPRFKVWLSPSQPTGDKSCIQLVCQLDDKDLPTVPHINVTILQDYPKSSPLFRDCPDYLSTPFLERVDSALSARLLSLPARHTLSQLLTAWELSVRAACSPSVNLAPASGILSGL